MQVGEHHTGIGSFFRTNTLNSRLTATHTTEPPPTRLTSTIATQVLGSLSCANPQCRKLLGEDINNERTLQLVTALEPITLQAESYHQSCVPAGTTTATNYKLTECIKYLTNIAAGHPTDHQSPFCDPVSLTDIENAVILQCGHTLDETIVQAIGQTSTQPQCPTCKTNITKVAYDKMLGKMISILNTCIPHAPQTTVTATRVIELLEASHYGTTILNLNKMNTYSKVHADKLATVIDAKLIEKFGERRITRHFFGNVPNEADRVDPNSGLGQLQALAWRIDCWPVIIVDLCSESPLILQLGDNTVELGGWYNNGTPSENNRNVACLYSYPGSILVGSGSSNTNSSPPALLKATDTPHTHIPESILNGMQEITKDYQSIEKMVNQLIETEYARLFAENPELHYEHLCAVPNHARQLTTSTRALIQQKVGRRPVRPPYIPPLHAKKPITSALQRS